MRTSLDLPDPLFRTLKANAALQGTSLRDHVISLIERGMNAPSQAASVKPATAYQVPRIPTLTFSEPIDRAAFLLTNEQINEILDNDEMERYERVMRQLEKPHGSS